MVMMGELRETAADANTVADAIGIRIHDLPLAPEKVSYALDCARVGKKD